MTETISINMIKTYQKDEHKSGFIGVRVAVMVDGKAMQKYFSFKSSDKNEDDILSDAKLLHARWMMEKNLASSKRDVASKELRRVSSPFSTGTKGIKFRVSHNTCYFYVQGMTKHIRFNQHFNINRLGYEFAWFKACEYLQKNKDYALLDSVYKNKPAEERLLIVFRHLYFTKSSAVHLRALIGVIDESILISWFKQLLLQYPNNKQFKEDVLEYFAKNNVKGSLLPS